MSQQPCLGIMLPDDGPDDYEWYSLGDEVPGLPRIRVGKVPSDGHHAPAALLALGAVERLAPPGERLVDEAGARAVVWACTSASFIGGLEWAREQNEALASRLGVPVTSTALAFLDALAALGHARVDLLSPYPDDVTLRLVSFLREGGVSVVNDKALDCPYATDSHRADLGAEVRRFCARYPDASRPLLVPDTAVNSLFLREVLSRETGRELLTANQVTLWAGLRRLGADLPEGLLGPLAVL
ncbi:aspartate racemase/maleate isomerase family protein [Halomonas ventosae]|uniref:Maleate isomerase n=1 Tax=Halomonas ventosae TaxID=229007 RepID=A0A2T0VSW5_9GAMM|nr:maleate cis-trans isomerase [Halomonas ventosae]PRY73680.1 maleate isomerase [Halomonas ventosae]